MQLTRHQGSMEVLLSVWLRSVAGALRGFCGSAGLLVLPEVLLFVFTGLLEFSDAVQGVTVERLSCWFAGTLRDCSGYNCGAFGCCSDVVACRLP